MKTGEEFLSHAEERLMLLKIFGYTPKEDQIKDLCKIMEQFRKEGMEEAWKQGAKNIADCQQLEKDILSRKISSIESRIRYNELLTFEEWYNNQIKE